ncbi:RIP metalloprotease RseP [Maritimibacter sp. 55A14]|uniref:RIP metalloprotease RseP n=1 Tax=Maritimibacter sp. 55A14 TaxID=2174844 RepID=UPI000D60BB9E|nr:RIP metalloprotease RseP [Maritimibacter sp. 55A14]PWE34292.1 RIP metalloprotease RseP [Maritimibacter sp. 55A14]
MDIVSLLPSFGGFAATVIAFILALSIIVFVHEFGHYIVGRWCGIGAEVFSLGFGPVLWSRVDARGTRWQVAALPFGGYVKFLGDADAASGRDDAALEAARGSNIHGDTMHGAPLWARSATVAAGPVANFILSILVFAMVFIVGGLARDTPIVGALKPLPQDIPVELQPGDRILAVDGNEVPSFEAYFDYADSAAPAPSKSYLVERDSTRMTVEGPFPMPPLVSSVQPRSAAIAAGLEAGDMIRAVDGQPIASFNELKNAVTQSGTDPLRLTIWRSGQTLEIALLPKIVDLPADEGGWETRKLIGITGSTFFEPHTYTPGPLEALKLGSERTWGVITGSLSGLWHMVTGAISSCNLQGPIGIAEVSGAAASQGLESFIWFIAVLSTAVGMLNLFPIPVLDGGHLVFFGYEAVTGRPPSDRALQIMMTVGLTLILSLMVFGLTNDLFCP